MHSALLIVTMGVLTVFGAVLAVTLTVSGSHLGEQIYVGIPEGSYFKDVAVEYPACEPGSSYSMPHHSFCDLFYNCRHGQVQLGQCDDGLVYDFYNGCRMHHSVDCSSRPYLQAPRGTGNCHRLNGVFPDPHGCGRFIKCANGTAFFDKCPEGQVFEDTIKGCRLATEKEYSHCHPHPVIPPVVSYVALDIKPIIPSYPQVALPVATAVTTVSVIPGFECPMHDVYPYGEHSRHPYPGKCTLYVMCMKDHTVKVGSCTPGTVYNPGTGLCDHPEKVPGCF